MSASTAPASQAVRSRPAVAASVLPALKSTRLLDQLRERVRYLHDSTGPNRPTSIGARRSSAFIVCAIRSRWASQRWRSS
jgi:hypothetical protein